MTDENQSSQPLAPKLLSEGNRLIFTAVGGAIILILLVLAVMSGSDNDDPAPSREPTPVVFPNIERESDCGVLQGIFNNAERAGDAARAEGDLDLARAHTDAMRRADGRMDAVGCY